VELGARLSSIGLTRSQFGEMLGVSSQAVGNWKSRGMPERAERLLEELELGYGGEALVVGSLVRVDGRQCRLVRVDHCQTLTGFHRIYWCRSARKGKWGWRCEGEMKQYHPRMVKYLGDVEWE